MTQQMSYLPQEFEALNELSVQIRSDLLASAHEVFQQEQATVIAIGSTADGTADPYSDLDVWVRVPDEKIDDIVARRRTLYSQVGSVMISWERPRFAPLGGIHSVLLYDDARSPLPVEVDYYVASETMTGYYDGLIQRTHRAKDFAWQEGEDDDSLPSTINYCSLVTLWAAKYLARGSRAELSWAKQRYDEARSRIPDLPPITDVPSSPDTLLQILEGLSSVSEIGDKETFKKIGNAVLLANTRE